ncbi:MAG: putative CAMK family protein kinase [Streblomastix strix]|uniref:Putative CAMK family protein kinase n=1 Tax=Streblomastix strix TaxID=222440 RepID=A0A5J4WDG3_9EUKA|nr:MAG: putative CAMK family protein kinase [Streblomastix strix]
MQKPGTDYEEDNLRMERFVPIRLLGKGAFGNVWLAFHNEIRIVAVKIIEKSKNEKHEWNAALHLIKTCELIITEVANCQTLNIIAKQPQIPLASYTLRALMKQILQGMKEFHKTGLVHRDIKCENILMHSPPESGRVYVKIADFGLAKKEDLINEQSYLAGTLPYQAPELFQKPIRSTFKVDIYALGITFYRIITHKFPINSPTFDGQKKKIEMETKIERPSEIKDDILWDLLSQLLEFDPDKRITAEQALQHPYFTSPEANADISQEQIELAQQAVDPEQDEDSNFTEFDKDPTFIVTESEIRKDREIFSKRIRFRQYPIEN